MLYIFFGIAAVSFGIDMLTKVLLTSEVTLIPGFISIHPVHNDGAAFSIFSGLGVWLIIFTAGIIFIGIHYYFHFYRKGLTKSVLFHVAAALILGGALGNLFDRIFFGYVRDFIRLDFINFPIFNFADICLNVGVVLLIWWLLFIYRGKPNAT